MALKGIVIDPGHGGKDPGAIGLSRTKEKILTLTYAKSLKEALDKGKTDLRLSYFKVWISGLFYRMFMDELSGIKPDFLPFVKDIDSAKGTKNRLNDLKNRAKYYYEDYLCWKDSLIK